MTTNWKRTLYWVLACSWYAFFLFHKIDLTTADLGRHIKNGEWFFLHHQIPSTNFYSYTFPDFPVVNHHWGSGVLFFLVWKWAGFPGLSVFFALVSLAAFAFFYRVAERESPDLAFIAALLAIPLLAERLEIRPEAISYLFCGIFFWLLWNDRSRWFWVIPILEAVWVNCHIYFFMGPLLVGIFWVWSLLGDSSRSRRLLILLVLTEAATLISPFGIRSALAPLEIFQNYGYQIVENQSIPTLVHAHYALPNLVWFKLVFAILVLVIVWERLFGGRRVSPVLASLAVLVSMMGWLALRNLALFGFFSIPIMTITAHRALPRGKFLGTCLAAVLSVLVFAMSCGVHRYVIRDHARTLGVGLLPGNMKPAEYFIKNNLSGPIMNNYDIGGYLIYGLFNKERVYVDNRPEAYPASFFQESYIPMQSDEKIWQQQDKKWHFNVICFDYHEHSRRSLIFMLQRLRDPEWAPVFADKNVLIWLRRTSQNSAVIRRDEIPRSRFVIPHNA